ncbi:MAG: hypothetical protein ACKODB_04175 [Betaproteobacteria bacterium]|jgi:hypothetical protein
MTSTLRWSGLRVAFCAALVLLLSGCFDIEQSLRIRQDTFTYEAIVRIDARLVAMAQAGSKLDCEKFALTQAERSPAVKVTFSEKNDGTNLVCHLTIQGPVSAAAFADFPARMEFKPRSDDHPVFGKDGGMGFTIEKLGRNRFRLTSRMMLSSSKSSGSSSSQSERLGEQFAAMMMGGRQLRWAIEAEQILSSNGQISAKGSEVKWEAPLASAIKSPQTFTAEFSLPLSWPLRTWYRFLDFLDGLRGR